MATLFVGKFFGEEAASAKIDSEGEFSLLHRVSITLLFLSGCIVHCNAYNTSLQLGNLLSTLTEVREGEGGKNLIALAADLIIIYILGKAIKF